MLTSRHRVGVAVNPFTSDSADSNVEGRSFLSRALSIHRERAIGYAVRFSNETLHSRKPIQAANGGATGYTLKR